MMVTPSIIRERTQGEATDGCGSGFRDLSAWANSKRMWNGVGASPTVS